MSVMSTTSDRFTLYRLIDAKLSGRHRAEALGFARRADPTSRQRLIERLGTLPDIGRMHGATVRLSDEQVAAMRSDRRDGDTLRVIADRYGASYSYVQKICSGRVRA